MGTEKTQDLLNGWKPMFCKRTSPKDERLVEKPKNFSEDQKKELAQKKENSSVEASQAFKRKNLPQRAPKKDKQAPKSNQKGKKKEKGKAKYKWNKPDPQKSRIPKEEKTAMENVFKLARTFLEFKNKEEERLN
ncbi:hypothetical protein O181_015606 [Austropuccinia psidii MF-1]|uniref:Uncharacterized protein n=1 Tax=Austropuccinia psidii MF-1 TaxID=1389203 RepID=A0A9Q3C081_9BASI|nr:hypothetical protein [Austropuccinia psidii MF-1]